VSPERILDEITKLIAGFIFEINYNLFRE